MVQELDLFGVVFRAGLNALSEKIVGGLVDDFLCVGLFVIGPADELLLVLSAECVFGGQFADQFAGFRNRFDVLLKLVEFELVAVDAAGHLAVCAERGSGEE